MHPMGSLVVGLVAGAIFVFVFGWCQRQKKLDDVLGVWALHGVCGVWGGIAAGIFGLSSLGGLGGVSLMSQIVGTLVGISIAFIGGLIVYGVIRSLIGLRLTKKKSSTALTCPFTRSKPTPRLTNLNSLAALALPGRNQLQLIGSS